MSELLSVIVPVYQVEDCLRECVDSLLCQTCRPMEVILVDDGSTDNSPAICDDYAARDSRIRVLHQTNQGLSAARNAGMEAARGEWIGFVDSDDLVSPRFFEVALQVAAANPDIDVVEMPLMSRFNTPNAKRYVPGDEVIKGSSDDIFSAWLSHEGYVRAYAQTKIYRRSAIAAVRFPVGKTFEDLHFILPVLKACRGYACTSHPDATYFYRYRQQSITVQARFRDIESQLEAMLLLAHEAIASPSVAAKDRQLYALRVANRMIDAQRAGRLEGWSLRPDFQRELSEAIDLMRPTFTQLLMLPIPSHDKLKNLTLSLFGICRHLSFYAR